MFSFVSGRHTTWSPQIINPRICLNERFDRLEEKIAYLERHVAEQDKAMLEMAEELAKLRREFAAVRDRLVGGAGPADEDSHDERPPHY